MQVQNGRDLVVVAYGGEPIGNETVSVKVHDPISDIPIFGEYSRLYPMIEDVTGDEHAELILYDDTQSF